MELLISFLTTLNSLSPLAVIALLGTVIFILVKGKSFTGKKISETAAQVSEIKDNHLHEMPAVVEGIKEMNETLRRMEMSMSENFAYIKARINGANR